MLRHFGPLAREAFSRPSAHVLSHGRPYDFGGDGLSRPFYSWMTQSVNEIKNSSSTFVRDVRPREAVGNVDNNVVTSYVHRLEVESTSCFVSQPLELRIEGLQSGDLFPIHAQISDGVDYAGEIGSGDFKLHGGSVLVVFV